MIEWIYIYNFNFIYEIKKKLKKKYNDLFIILINLII